MTLAEYTKALLRSWLIIGILIVFGGAGGYVAAKSTPDTFRSSSSLLLTSDQGGSTSELVQGSNYVQNLVATYVLLAQSEIVLQPVIDDLNLGTSAQALASTITVSSPLNTVIINISATNHSADMATQITVGVTKSLSEVVSSEVSPTNAGNPTIRLTTIQEATSPKFAIAPNSRQYVAIGAVLGLLLGIIFALVRSLVQHPLSNSKDVNQVTTSPVLGEIVESKRDMTLPGAVLADPLSLEAESLRSFAANLNFLRVDGGLRSFVITSASPGESKSSVALGLALSISESWKSVLVIDGDLRSPSLGTLTQLDSSVGLTNVLIGETTLEVAAQEWGHEGLYVVTAGSQPPNPGQLLSSKAMKELIDEASSQFDIVIVDSAPLLSVTDATWLGHMTDGTIVVTRRGKTTARSLARILGALEAATVPVLGIVISRMPRRTRARYGMSIHSKVH